MDLTAAILDMAVDDFTGLWEIVWRAQTLAPGEGETRVSQAASAGVRALLEGGAVTLYRGQRFAGEEVPLAPDDALTALDRPDSWLPPEEGEMHLRLHATDAGKTAYFSRST